MSFFKVLMHFLLKPLTRCYDGVYCEGKTWLINWGYSSLDVTCLNCIEERYLDAVRPWEEY